MKSRTKSELREEARTRSKAVSQDLQTHSVFIGKFRYPAYIDGEVVRHIVDGRVLAQRTERKGVAGWSARVQEARPLKGTLTDRGTGFFDNIVPIGGYRGP